MDKTYKPADFEDALYREWEEKGLFTAHVNKEKKPFTIILPPPNANADLHLGHAMYVYEDIMIRYKKLRGFETLWLPGADHAGIETQYVFEKHLAKQGKSRFDYDRDTLFGMIRDFVNANRGTMEQQLRKLGFALDWSREKYTLDDAGVRLVKETFKRLHDDGLVYRDVKLVNFCVKDGTSFSDLEVKYVEKTSPFYYIKYGPFEIGTVRPETKFRDTALAVNPSDKRYKKWIGKTLEIPGLLGPIKMTVIPDEGVDPEFGTGIMKVTPAHDSHDFELGKKFNLPVTPIIDFQGRMDFSWYLEKKDADPKYMERAKRYHGMKVEPFRALMVEHLKEDGLLLRVDDTYVNRVATCYKCGRPLEPLPMEQWFVRVRPLADRAIKGIKDGDVKFTNDRFERAGIQWLVNFHDWNISRQNVWGIRIPAYKCKSKGTWFASVDTPVRCEICNGSDFEQDPDIFDTWFSSGQWPVTTLKTTKKGDFDYFYPTSVMETGYDILPWWVCRMLMFGYYLTGKPPFRNVYLHGLIRVKGEKMSKSKGNVINPLKMIELYGTDALRAALVFEVGDGTDLSISEEKIRGMRNFMNKVWNIGRFIAMNRPAPDSQPPHTGSTSQQETITALKKEFDELRSGYRTHMDGFQFSFAFGDLYEFMWHRFADHYIEALKEPLKNGDPAVFRTLESIYLEGLVMLHPFIPFVTDAVHKSFRNVCILEKSTV